MPMQPLAITAFTLVTALGRGVEAQWQALRHGRGGLRPNDFAPAAGLETWIGRVAGVEETALPEGFAPWHCRNHQLAELALAQDRFEQAVAAARARFGAERVAVIMGTSTSGILAGELAFRERRAHGRMPAGFDYRRTQELGALSDYLQLRLALAGPAYTVSTACSSSAKVFADAHRLIGAGLCDAAVVGGVDSLCLTTLYGFSSLELVSRLPCRPADAARDGISIGEAAGFALVTRAGEEEEGPLLLGYGESSDAHHMSTPHPEGLGAQAAMRGALARAGVGPEAVDYINLHGTATPSNDRAEDRAVQAVLPGTPCSSTKGWTGHTLGAAGITEAVFSLLALRNGWLPGSLNTQRVDPEFGSAVLLEGRAGRVARVLSNSFGFGGSNVSLLFGRRT